MHIKWQMFWDKKWASQVNYFWSYWLQKMCLFKGRTGLLSESPVAVNVLTSPKNSWSLWKSTFILLFLIFEPNWVRKSHLQSDLRFYDCLIKRWPETTNILVVIERIYRYQFKSNYLKNDGLFAAMFLDFRFLLEIYNVLKKK